MSRVVDTSAWIEGIIRGVPDSRILRLLPSRAEWIVPTIVQFELAKWLYREVDEAFAGGVLGYSAQCVIAELTTPIALAAADYCRLHKLPGADAIIYATAMATSSDLLTCDSHFEGLPKVVYVPKLAS